MAVMAPTSPFPWAIVCVARANPNRTRYKLMIGAEGQAGPKVYWEPTITLGNILSMAGMLLAGFGVFMSLKADVQTMQLVMNIQGKSLEGIENLISSRAAVRYDRPDADRDFSVRDRRLDADETRIGSNEGRILALEKAVASALDGRLK